MAAICGATRAARFVLIPLLSSLAPLASAGTLGADPGLAARRPLSSHPPLAAEQHEALAEGLPFKDFRVVVKFRDDARLRVGGPEGPEREGHEGGTGITSAPGGCAAEVEAVVRSLGLGRGALRPLFADVGPALEALLARGAARSGVAQPDLRGVAEVRVDGNNATRMLEIQAAFDHLACTEFTSVNLGPARAPRLAARRAAQGTAQDAAQDAAAAADTAADVPCHPPCAPGATCSVPTGNCTPFFFDQCDRNLKRYSRDDTFFRALQRYRTADFVDVDYANAKGAVGQGVTIADTENAFAHFHQALPRSILLNPPFVPREGFTDLSHGTAVQSILVGNEHLPGIAPEAQSSFWSNAGSKHQAETIAAAAATLKAGDVFLYEVAFPVSPLCPCAGGNNNADILAEVLPDIFLVTKAATDAGIIVVEAAGNGDVNLDDTECGCLGYNLTRWLSWGDSGAIVIGGGSANSQREKVPASTFGARVNVQAWAEDVIAADYSTASSCGECTSLKDFSVPGHPEFSSVKCSGEGVNRNKTYQGGFDGTSSASAISAGAVAALQSYNTDILGREALLPREMRQLLVETGAPQGGANAATQHIGPLIKLRAAIERLDEPLVGRCCFHMSECPDDLTASSSTPGCVGVDNFCSVSARRCTSPQNEPDGCDGTNTGTANVFCPVGRPSLLDSRRFAAPARRHAHGGPRRSAGEPARTREEVDVGSFLQVSQDMRHAVGGFGDEL